MKLLRFFFNKYTITGAAFAALMLFFDQNDFVSMKERNNELQNTKKSIEFLNKEIAEMDEAYAALMKDPQSLEKYAREHFRMKRDNEDLYIVERK